MRNARQWLADKLPLLGFLLVLLGPAWVFSHADPAWALRAPEGFWIICFYTWMGWGIGRAWDR